MIRKTIIAALVLFIVYNVVLGWMHPLAGPGQNQWQKNRIAVEDYVDNYQGIQVVIVGTSLSARLYPSLLPDGYYNLALSGQSILDGLQIVKQCKKKPKFLLVESNFYYFKLDQDITEGIFDPAMLYLRKWVPSFREENQPSNLLVPLVKKTQANVSESMDTGVTNKLLRERVTQYLQLPDSNLVNHSVDLLKKDFAELRAEGVKIVLYDIPINCKLENLPGHIKPMKRFEKEFPFGQYVY